MSLQHPVMLGYNKIHGISAYFIWFSSDEIGASTIKGKFESSRAPKEPKKKPKPTKADSAASKQEKGPGNGKKIALICCAAVAAIAIGVVGWGVALTKTGNILPNVTVAGVNVGGMSRDEAKAAIQKAVDETYGTMTLAVQLPDRTLSFEPADTKVTMDVDAVVDAAWRYGRDQGIFQAISMRMTAKSGMHTISATGIDLDQAYVQSVLDGVAQEVLSSRKDATYELVEVDAPVPEGQQAPEKPVKIPSQIKIQTGSAERSLDVQGLMTEILNAYLNNNFTSLKYDYTETPYTAVDLEALYNQLSAGTKDAYYDTEKKEIVPEIVGYGFDLEAEKQRQAMAEENSELIIDLKVVEPEITKAELDAKLFHDVLGAVESPHVHNYDRTINLKLACEAINGTILNPGDVFSFNKIVGERTAAKGYRPATVYVSGESKPELGGGVCQVASAIYYATLLADLEIVERTEHMFSVTYVPMGMDATIYWGSLDYQFKNNTKYPLRIDASVRDGNVYIDLVGTDERDYKIEMEYEILSTNKWTDVEKIDEKLPADYKAVTVTPYTGYTVQTYKHFIDKATGKEIKVVKEDYSAYSKRDRVTTIGKAEEKPVEDPTKPTDPGTTPPTTDPGTTPPTTDPGTTPPTDPGTTPPVTDPGTTPPVDPGTTPPVTDPGTTPPTDQGSNSSSGVLE